MAPASVKTTFANVACALTAEAALLSRATTIGKRSPALSSSFVYSARFRGSCARYAWPRPWARSSGAIAPLGLSGVNLRAPFAPTSSVA